MAGETGGGSCFDDHSLACLGRRATRQFLSRLFCCPCLHPSTSRCLSNARRADTLATGAGGAAECFVDRVEGDCLKQNQSCYLTHRRDLIAPDTQCEAQTGNRWFALRLCWFRLGIQQFSDLFATGKVTRGSTTRVALRWREADSAASAADFMG